MASEISVKLVVRAVLAGSIQAVLGGAKGPWPSACKQNTSDWASSWRGPWPRLARPLAKLRQRYEALGRTLDQIRHKTEALNQAMARGETLKAARKEKAAAMR